MSRRISTGACFCMVLGALSVVAGLVALSKLDRAARFTPSRDLSEAVADPDIAMTPYLHMHLE